MPCVRNQIEANIVVLHGEFDVLSDVRGRHQVVLAANQVPLRNPQRQQCKRLQAVWIQTTRHAPRFQAHPALLPTAPGFPDAAVVGARNPQAAWEKGVVSYPSPVALS